MYTELEAWSYMGLVKWQENLVSPTVSSCAAMKSVPESFVISDGSFVIPAESSNMSICTFRRAIASLVTSLVHCLTFPYLIILHISVA